MGIDHPKQTKVVDWVFRPLHPEQRENFDLGAADAVAALEEWVKTDDFAASDE